MLVGACRLVSDADVWIGSVRANLWHPAHDCIVRNGDDVALVAAVPPVGPQIGRLVFIVSVFGDSFMDPVVMAKEDIVVRVLNRATDIFEGNKPTTGDGDDCAAADTPLLWRNIVNIKRKRVRRGRVAPPFPVGN